MCHPEHQTRGLCDGDARALGSFDNRKHLRMKKGHYADAVCGIAESASVFSTTGEAMDISPEEQP